MKQHAATKTLHQWDRQGHYVFLKRDLKKLFDDESRALELGLTRLVKANILQRVCRGVYVNPHAECLDSYTIERIAKALRRGHYNYVSLESMLSEYGVISQVPLDRLTIMSTGREGTFDTAYGIIEFTHTTRTVEDILDNTYCVDERPMRLATKYAAWRDLKRVGRNIHLVDQQELDSD